MSVAEYSRLTRENTAKNKGMTVTEYNKELRENAAKNKGMTLSEYSKELRENTAKNKGMTLTEHTRHTKENLAKSKGLTFTEYNRLSKETAAKNKGMTVAEYRRYSRENIAKSKGLTLAEYSKMNQETVARNQGFSSVTEYLAFLKARKLNPQITPEEFLSLRKEKADLVEYRKLLRSQPSYIRGSVKRFSIPLNIALSDKNIASKYRLGKKLNLLGREGYNMCSVILDTVFYRCTFTDKESIFFKAYLEGLTLEQIGRKFGCVGQTVTNNLNSVMRKIRIAYSL